MADKYAVNYAKLVATPQPSAIPPDYRGRQRPIYDEYTVVAGDVVNDRVFVGYLEPGDKVIDGYIDTDALGGTATLILGDSDDVRATTQLNYVAAANRMVIRANLPPNTAYRVKLNSTRIETPDGDVHLDGEFNGTFPSGNGLSGGQGVSGGSFEFQVKNDLTNTPIVRMSTSEGVMSLRMRRDAAPLTVANFVNLARRGFYGVRGIPISGAGEAHGYGLRGEGQSERKNENCVAHHEYMTRHSES